MSNEGKPVPDDLKAHFKARVHLLVLVGFSVNHKYLQTEVIVILECEVSTKDVLRHVKIEKNINIIHDFKPLL